MTASAADAPAHNDPALLAGGFALSATEASEKQRRKRETMQFYGGVTLEEFARNLGLQGADVVKLLKRWIDKGREVSPPDLPPFQRPHELAAWWRRMQSAGVMGKRPPDWMTLAEQAGPTPLGTAAPAPPTPPAGAGEVSTAGGTASAKEVPPGDLPPDFVLPELDSQATSGEKQLLEFAQGWLAEMNSAKKAKDSKRFFRAWTEYKILIKELRSWQKDRQRERLQSGEVLEAEKERIALGIIFSAMGKTFTTSLDLVVQKFRPDLDALERRKFVMPLRDRIFAALKDTRYAQAVTDEILATFLAAA